MLCYDVAHVRYPRECAHKYPGSGYPLTTVCYVAFVRYPRECAHMYPRSVPLTTIAIPR
ncbi:hypothetical protein HanRHA438_Chr08g0347011 [Helianthus annuus]|nr:hypothetical protein HanRHA438_Chr08g0347011 [Helianthus annuus]